MKRASGPPCRALLHAGIIYCKDVPRWLISLGQVRAVLGLGFLWVSSPEIVVECEGSLCRVLTCSVHNSLPILPPTMAQKLVDLLRQHAFGELGEQVDWEKVFSIKLMRTTQIHGPAQVSHLGG
eukprot:3746561-Amphidinium_carterae.1